MNSSINRVLLSPLVLIVDDDLTTTLLLDGLLRSAGFETLCAYDLAGAEALFHKNSVSLILLDVHLPDGNGLDLCKKIAARSSIPVIFISANDDVEIKVQGFAAGGVDYVTKPFAGPEILARVRTHLRLRAAYDALDEMQAEKIARLAASQQALMPQSENYPEACFSVRMKQALLAGGDFYDVIPSGSHITDYIVADASGHDLGVSLWTASFKTLLSEYASVLYTPGDICRILNKSLLRVLPENAYFTAIYARLNRKTKKLVLINAGHPSAILLSTHDGSVRVLEQEGDLLGIFPDVVFGSLEIPVKPGDRLFLFSDGLIELDGSREKGMDLLVAAIGTTSGLALPDAIQAVVKTLCTSCSPDDDIVLLGVEV